MKKLKLLERIEIEIPIFYFTIHSISIGNKVSPIGNNSFSICSSVVILPLLRFDDIHSITLSRHLCSILLLQLRSTPCRNWSLQPDDIAVTNQKNLQHCSSQRCPLQQRARAHVELSVALCRRLVLSSRKNWYDEGNWGLCYFIFRLLGPEYCFKAIADIYYGF